MHEQMMKKKRKKKLFRSHKIKNSQMMRKKSRGDCVLCIKNYRYVRDAFFELFDSETKDAEPIEGKGKRILRGIKCSLRKKTF
jgi:hypothetical protein